MFITLVCWCDRIIKKLCVKAKRNCIIYLINTKYVILFDFNKYFIYWIVDSLFKMCCKLIWGMRFVVLKSRNWQGD